MPFRLQPTQVHTNKDQTVHEETGHTQRPHLVSSSGSLRGNRSFLGSVFRWNSLTISITLALQAPRTSSRLSCRMASASSDSVDCHPSQHTNAEQQGYGHIYIIYRQIRWLYGLVAEYINSMQNYIFLPKREPNGNESQSPARKACRTTSWIASGFLPCIHDLMQYQYNLLLQIESLLLASLWHTFITCFGLYHVYACIHPMLDKGLKKAITPLWMRAKAMLIVLIFNLI